MSLFIKEQGWPVPVKSGCFFCPFARLGQLRRLWERHPHLYRKAESLELNSRNYPWSRMFDKPLWQLRKRFDDGREQSTLDGYERGCVMCHL